MIGENVFLVDGNNTNMPCLDVHSGKKAKDDEQQRPE